MDTPAFNIQFIETVEKYPCIYDYTRKDHSRRDIVERAWNSIGSEVKLPGSQCKEKWKNLRTAFARSMKKPPSGSGAKKNKDYYLKDVMQFITPFMKSHPQQGNLPAETESSLNENNDSESEAEANNDDYSEQEITTSVKNSQEKQTDITTVIRTSQEKNPSIHAQCSNTASTASIGSSEKRRKVSASTLNEADKCFMEYVKSKTSKTNPVIEKPNPDLQFLTSLLPDLAKLTDYQKRQFKKRTLELLDELLCDGPSLSTHSSHTFSPSEYGEPPTPVQTYMQAFSPDMSDVINDRNLSLTLI